MSHLKEVPLTESKTMPLCSCGDCEDARRAAHRMYCKLLENQCPVWARAVSEYFSAYAKAFVDGPMATVSPDDAKMLIGQILEHGRNSSGIYATELMDIVKDNADGQS